MATIYKSEVYHTKDMSGMSNVEIESFESIDAGYKRFEQLLEECRNNPKHKWKYLRIDIKTFGEMEHADTCHSYTGGYYSEVGVYRRVRPGLTLEDATKLCYLDRTMNVIECSPALMKTIIRGGFQKDDLIGIYKKVLGCICYYSDASSSSIISTSTNRCINYSELLNSLQLSCNSEYLVINDRSN